MPLAQPADRRENALPAGEGLLGLRAEPGPGVRAGPPASSRRPGRADGTQMRIERARPSAREAAVRTPTAHERDHEVTAGIPAQEFDRVMGLAEPDANAVRELSLERPATGAIKADRANRALQGNAMGFVERGEVGHAPTMPGAPARVCATSSRVCADRPNGTRCRCHLVTPTPRRLQRSLTRSTARPSGIARALDPFVRQLAAARASPNDTGSECHLDDRNHARTNSRCGHWGSIPDLV